MDAQRGIAARWFAGVAKKTLDDVIEERMLPGVRLVDIPEIADPEVRSQAITSHRIWAEHFKVEEEERQGRGRERVVFRR